MRWALHAEVANLARKRGRSICSLVDAVLVQALRQHDMATGIERLRRSAFASPSSSKKTRRVVSIRGPVYDRVFELAEQQGVRATSLIDGLLCDELERAGVCIARVKTPDREYKREGRPRRVEEPLIVRRFDDGPWFGGYAEFGGSGSAQARIVEPRAAPRDAR